MKASLIAALFAVAVLPAAAQTATPKVDARQTNQEARIQQGVKSGQLTSKEAVKLEKGQDKVQVKKDQAKADGKVTAKERVKLGEAQDKQSRKITKAKHNQKKQAPAS